jgi:predicted MFS family arabinose efflux permease
MALASEDLRGRYMGLQGLGCNMSTAVAYLTSAVLGVALGWRQAFLIWGLVGIVMEIIDYIFIVDIPCVIV